MSASQVKGKAPPLAELFSVGEFIQSAEHHPSARAATIERCLSIRQPWALAISRGWKCVENRTWPPGFSGWIAIHASGKPNQLDHRACNFVEDAAAYIATAIDDESTWPTDPATGKPWNPAQSGAIIGIARIVGHIDRRTARGEFFSLCESAGDPYTSWYDKRFDAVSIEPDYWSEKGCINWMLDDMRLLAQPIKADGKLNLWRLSPEQQAALLAARVLPQYPVPAKDRM